jgi:oxygen-independent coproporphyrinogen-3 oxidase
VAEILEHYLERDEASFASIDYGVSLDGEERRRRHVIQSLLVRPGLDVAQYQARFGSDCFEDLPQLRELFELGLATRDESLVALNESGLARADTIGPWLISGSVADRMRDYRPD